VGSNPTPPVYNNKAAEVNDKHNRLETTFEQITQAKEQET